MGTSSPFRGPKGRRPLLPPWPDAASSDDGPAPENPEAPRPEVPPPVPTETWNKVKRSFSQFVAAGGSRVGNGGLYLRRAGSRFVKAQGGARTAAQGARAGRRTAQSLGVFLATAATAGLAEAVRSLGIEEYIGKDAWSFLSDLVDVLAPDGATIDDAVARRALTATLSELYGGETELDVVARLNQLTSEAIGITVERYIARYVYTQLLEVMGSRLYGSSRSPEEIRRLEQDVQDYVFQTVRLSVREVDLRTIDLGGQDGKHLIEDTFAEGYAYLEQIENA